MIKIILSATTLVLLSWQAIAQHSPLPVSPTSTQLSNSDKETVVADIYNVDPFTGIGSVNLPIYGYSVDGLDLGVSLIYNNKGIRVDDISSSIGLGWDINAGGYITREVNGIEDEFELKGKSYNNHQYDLVGSWAQHQAGFVDQEKQPDILTANFGGRSMKIAIKFPTGTNVNYPDAIVYTEPKSAITIKFHIYFGGTLQLNNSFEKPPLFEGGLSGALPNPMNPQTYINFTIIDEKGNEFYFERGDWEKKYPYETPSTKTALMYSTQKWVLKKVTTFTGVVVNYNYQTSWVNYPLYKNELVRENPTYGGSPFLYNSLGIFPGTIDSIAVDEVGWSGYVSQLKSIEYPNGTTVNFHIDSSDVSRCDIPGAHVVDSIEVKSQYENDYRNSFTYVLKHSYFHTPHSSNSATYLPHHTPCQDIENIGGAYYHWYAIRLRLDSIMKVGNYHLQPEKFYEFTYHATPLPLRFSPKTDYYGYYNNGSITPVTINSNTYYFGVPYHAFQFSYGTDTYYGTDKSSDATTNLDYIQAGILKKVKNNLGGEVEFFYKKPVLSNPTCSYGDNSYRDDVPDGVVVPYSGDCTIDQDLFGSGEPDGLIIDKIQKRDGFSYANDIEISYNYSNGNRFFKGGYFWFLKTAIGTQCIQKLYTNHIISPQKFFNGSNHGFSNVTIVTANPNTTEILSKTAYNFSNLIMDRSMLDSTTNSLYNLQMPADGKSILNLKTGLYYHTNYPDFQQCFLGLVKETKEYGPSNTLVSTKINKYSWSPHFTNYYPTPNGYVNPGILENWHYFSWDTINITTIPPQLKTGFYWGDRRPAMSNGVIRLSNSTVIASSGNTSLTTNYQYEYDRKHNVKSISWTDSKNEEFKKEYTYLYDVNFCNTCLSDSLHHRIYERVTNLTKNKIISHKVTHPVITSTQGIYQFYNSRYISKLRFNHIYESTINGGADPTTAISEEASAFGGSTGLSSLMRVKEYTLFDSKNNVLETKYNERDIYESYIWDTRLAQKIAEVKNARYSDIAFTSFEALGSNNAFHADDKGNWLLDAAAVELYNSSTPVKPITGKYVYNLGSASITTKNNLTSTKKYLLSVWATDAVKVYTSNNSTTLITVSEQTLPIDGLRLYTAIIDGDGSQLNIAAPDVTQYGTPYIDELRLHPLDASMSTATFAPLLGVITKCDERNNILRIEYDLFGRESIIRNTKGEIISITKQFNNWPNN